LEAVEVREMLAERGDELRRQVGAPGIAVLGLSSVSAPVSRATKGL
jgi:hypothetical protein